MISDKARDAEQGMGGCWCIARERSDSAYIWDTEGYRKTEEVGIGDKLE